MEQELEAASKRLRGMAGYPRKPGRPKKSPAPAGVASPPPAPAETGRRSKSGPPQVEHPPNGPVIRDERRDPAVRPRLVDTYNGAIYCAVSKGTLRGLWLRGELRAVRFPGVTSLRFDVADLDRLIERSKSPATTNGHAP